MTNDEALKVALKQIAAGDRAGGEAIYRRILEADPHQSEALVNLAAIVYDRGEVPEASALLGLALEAHPEDPDAHHNLGVVLLDQGRLDEAVAHYREALGLRPGFVDAFANLAKALTQQGKHDEAADHYRTILGLQPNNVAAHYQLANVLQTLGQQDEAVSHYRSAVDLRPDDAGLRHDLANALEVQGRLDEALPQFLQVVRLQPEDAEGRVRLGKCLQKQGNLEAAIAYFRQAHDREPNSMNAVHNLGCALHYQGKTEESLAAFEQSLGLAPEYAEAHANRAMVWLLLGNFEEGWPEYEWRWLCPVFGGRPFKQPAEFGGRHFNQPAWDGSPLEGRTILLHAEQGLGDTLQFIRYVPVVKQLGARVVVECQPRLAPILRSCAGIDHLVAEGSPLPEFDVHAPLMSLPALLRTTVDTIPAQVPYLSADRTLVEFWRFQVGPPDVFKIGINWRGRPGNPSERSRGIPLREFAPLAGLPGVQLVSLQKGTASEEIREVGDRFTVVDLGTQVDEASGPFMDTAAVMQNLDLVITSDTVIPHLAGALGVPVWMPLPKVPDWRWLLDREDCPWYPTMRLFRQEKAGDWGPVFGRIAEALRKRLAAHQQSPPPGGAAVSSSEGWAGGPAIEVSAGELIDKIAILEIKRERIADPAKLANVRRELAGLVAARDRKLAPSAQLTGLTTELKEVNEVLWQIEDEIRDCERRQDFGPAFIALARAVYQQNDRRAAVKRRLNELLCSPIIEEKSYQVYDISRECSDIA